MQTTKNLKRAKNIFLLVATVFMAFTISSCATKAVFLQSAIVPAAEGLVTIKKDGNKNFTIKLKISNLADSENLRPPKKVYVVWMVSENNTAKNIGQIVSSKTTLTRKLQASFETVSSVRPSKIFITAENDATVQYPNSDVVLTTDYISSK